jgi:hypothetical protein
MSKPLYEPVKKITRIPREDLERVQDEERSIEINMMRALMRRYPEKAKEAASEMFRFVLTNRPA